MTTVDQLDAALSGHRTRWAPRTHGFTGQALVLISLLAAACGSDSTSPVVDTAPTSAGPPAPYVIPAAITARLRTEVIPFDGSHLVLPHGDLEPLREMIGEARVVALGENTHGTRDFFEMKARILRFLVEEMDFDAFAIEATWPEANRLDRYVRTGEGDAAVLLTGLYFWTWRTESVLEMIEWMREYNAAGGSVGFYGFDMQYPGMAMWNVQRFVDLVDLAAIAEFADMFSCMTPFVNGPRGYGGITIYGSTPPAPRDECYADLKQVEATLAERRDAYVAASSEQEFELAARSARLVVQYEEMRSQRATRDESMAENAIWLLDQLEPGARIVHWAHNFHVSDQPSAMGSRLRDEYGEDLVVIGFTHSSGSFTAVTQSSTGNLGLDEHTLDTPPDASHEDHFSSVGLPRFMLDLRGRNYTSGADAWLAVPRATRGIGCCYDPSNRGAYWPSQSLPELYDVIIHFESTRATTILAAEYPLTFAGN